MNEHIRLIRSTDYHNFQFKLDEFLHDNFGKFIDIKYSTCVDENSIFYSALIIYIPKKKD